MLTSLFYPGDLAFQPGLKFHSDYMRFFSPFARAEISGPVSKTGLDETGLEISAQAEIHPRLKLSSGNWKRRFRKICSRNRAEISARLTEMKS